MPRITVGVIVADNGVMHSIWISKEAALRYLEENDWMKSNWKADEYLVRGANPKTSGNVAGIGSGNAAA